MDWLNRMNKAMDYIESNLAGEISYDIIAQTACCSTYHFQRMFSFITSVPLSEYIRRRRLTLAAFELQTSDMKIIDAAYKYGYESPEAFSRAFKKQHGVMPTSARKKGVSLKAYPKMTFSIFIKGDNEMNYRIEEKEAFDMVGISKEISTIDGQNFIEIPNLWHESMANGDVDRLHEAVNLDKEECLHAALYNFRDGVFSYMICYHMPDSGTPDGYSKLSVPALTWAVFSTGECTEADGTEEIQDIWKRIFPEWFPTSGYEHADGPELEMYFALGNGKYNQEVWIPIVKSNDEK